MSKQTMVVAPDDRATSLNVVGEQITVLASGEQTGSYEIFLQAGPEGTGPPPHSHDWDEAFYVLRGEVAFTAGDVDRTAGPGTLVVVPRGTTHSFRLGAGGTEMLSFTSSAGAAAFFTDIDRQIAPDRPDLDTLVAVATAHGLAVAGPPAEVDAPA